jgi:hypothetical protein
VANVMNVPSGDQAGEPAPPLARNETGREDAAAPGWAGATSTFVNPRGPRFMNATHRLSGDQTISRPDSKPAANSPLASTRDCFVSSPMTPTSRRPCA